MSAPACHTASVVVRDAAEPDLPRILDITNEAIANSTAVFSSVPATLETRRAWMAERRAQGFPVIVAETDGTMAGFGAYGPFRAWPGYIATVEHSIYVDPPMQGRGLGRALLAALVGRAQDAGMHAMVAGIAAENTRSIALHEAAGFTRCGVLPQVGQKFGRWLDLLFMVRLLNDLPAPR